MADIILQRIGYEKVCKFANDMGFDVEQITEHQIRIENILDFYPKRNRFFDRTNQEWGTARSLNHLREVLLKAIPSESNKKEPINVFKEWYIHLCGLPHSDFTQGQLTMITNVLQKLMPEKEYKKLTEFPLGDIEGRINGQEKLI